MLRMTENMSASRFKFLHCEIKNQYHKKGNRTSEKLGKGSVMYVIDKAIIFFLYKERVLKTNKKKTSNPKNKKGQGG